MNGIGSGSQIISQSKKLQSMKNRKKERKEMAATAERG